MMLCLSKNYSQQLFILVYKGNVSANGIPISRGDLYQVEKDAKLLFPGKSSAIAINKALHNFIEINPETNQQLSFAELANKMLKAPVRNAAKAKNGKMQAGGFTDYVFKLHASREQHEATLGGTIAGVRGLNKNRDREEDIVTPFPEDSVSVLSETIRLSWAYPAIAGERLIVINTKTNDTIYNEPVSNKSEILVTIPSAGSYKWLLFSALENKRKVNRTIIRPTLENIKIMRESITVFKADLESLSGNMREQVLEDYYYRNNIIDN